MAKSYTSSTLEEGKKRRKLKHNLIPLPDNRMKEKRIRLTGWERYYIMRMIERIPSSARIEAEEKLYQKVAVDS